MIRILIIEDSTVVSMLLEAIINREPDMQVIGRAADGREGVRLVQELQPDLVTMDIRMPVMDGFEATRYIMSERPTPIVVVSSSVDDEELKITFRAIEEGALAVIEKPRGIHHPDFAVIREHLTTTIRAMAEIKLVRRFLHRRELPAARPSGAPSPYTWTRAQEQVALVGLGCSTGGPQVLQRIVAGLPSELPYPVVAVQHISPGFIGGLAAWLNEKSPLTIRLAQDGEILAPGCVYLAPDHYQFRIRESKGKLLAHLAQDEPVNGFRPSATPLFDSLAAILPACSAGGLLSGMGSDGARGLLAMRRAGCHTFVQDRDSAIVYGMPGEALALGAVDEVITLDEIPQRLARMGGRARSGQG